MTEQPAGNFFLIAMKIYPLLRERGYSIDFGHYTIYISRCGVLVNKILIYYNNNIKEYIILTDRHGVELVTHHYSDSDADIMKSFNIWFTANELY